MNKLRAAFIAACLALTLVVAAAPLTHTAHAAGSCTIVVTNSWSGIASESNGGVLRGQVALQDTKSSDGTYCYSRAIFKYWTTSGTETLDYRAAALYNGGSFLGKVESWTTVTATTTAQYWYSNWTDPCASVEAWGQAHHSGGALVSPQTFPY